MYLWYNADYYASLLKMAFFKALFVNGKEAEILCYSSSDRVVFTCDGRSILPSLGTSLKEGWAKALYKRLYSLIRKEFPQKVFTFKTSKGGFERFEEKVLFVIKRYEEKLYWEKAYREIEEERERERIAKLPWNYFKRTKHVRFINFGDQASGRLVAQFWYEDHNNYYGPSKYHYQIVYCRNPYGTHNLILIANGEAFRHGYDNVLGHLLKMRSWGICPKHVLSKAYKFTSSTKGEPWWKREYSQGFGPEVHNYVLK